MNFAQNEGKNKALYLKPTAKPGGNEGREGEQTAGGELSEYSES